ncbi:MAG: efflux RND transporter periplasmic adaptor subunit [Verrucomicrobiota bacterium]
MSRWLITLTIVVLVILAIGYAKYKQVQTAMAQFAHFAPPAQTITTFQVKSETWHSELSAIGTFYAVQGVTISSEEAGKIVKINFESGQEVKQGDVLVQLDTSVEEAQLNASHAMRDLAQTTHERTSKLLKEQAVTTSEFDEAQAKLKQTEAEVSTLEATIRHKTISAPFTGRLGIRLAQLGQFISPGTPLVNLQTLHPIYLNFSLPQNSVSQIKVGQNVTVTVDPYPGKRIEGKLSAIQPEIDPQTRNLNLQATFTNDDETLLPGMFGNVHLELNLNTKALVIPQTCIQYAPYGDAVYIIEKSPNAAADAPLVARQQFVKLGVTQGDWVQVLEGLQEGQEIATTGVFKLRQGSTVVINNTSMPTLDKNPQLKDQ